MPEGHSVHRIARQFALHFVGHQVAASSPQGRFAGGASEIDGRAMILSRALGKQLFLEFDNDRWLRVHLGMYGAWDFAGDITADASTASSAGRMGQTNQRGTVLDPLGALAAQFEAPSLGAPRSLRLRMAEQEKLESDVIAFPPDPVGAVRVSVICTVLAGPSTSRSSRATMKCWWCGA